MIEAHHDENDVPGPGKKQISSLLGPRRPVLGDVSNATHLKVSLLPKRSLRATTMQATLATKTKTLASIGSSATASLGTSSRSSSIVKPAACEQDAKENVAPGSRAYAKHPAVKRSAASAKLEWDDLDAEDEGDPHMVAEYAPEIFEYMLSIEENIIPGPGIMDLQKELNWHMRAVLIDWLIEVQWKSKLLPETLFLTVNIIDRFLSKRAVSLVKLQLVGLAASLLASKYEEVMSPSISNFVYFSDNAYDEQELLKAERYMLHVLGFVLAYPNPLVYLRRFSKADNYDIRHRTLAKYLMELTLLDPRFIPCPPSLVAAVGLWVARDMLKGGPWHTNLVHYSGGYTEADLQPWGAVLVDFLRKDAAKYEAVFKKYSSKKLMKASIFVQEYMKKYHGVQPTAAANTIAASVDK